jgi:hypothetical protein
VALDLRCGLGGGRGRCGDGWRGGDRGRGRHCHHLRLRATALYDLDLLLALSDLEFGDARFLDEVDQLLQLAQIHVGSSPVPGGGPPGAC